MSAFVFLFLYVDAQSVEYVSFDTLAYERGQVLSVDGFDPVDSSDAEGKPIGCQNVTVVIKSGPYTGEIYEVSNYLSHLYGTPLKDGDPVILSYTAGESGPVEYAGGR